MRKAVGTLVLLLIVASLVMAGGINIRDLSRQVLPPAPAPSVLEAAPALPEAGLSFSRAAGNPATGDTVIMTNYDLGWNSPTNHMNVVSYAPGATPGTRASFSFMYRAVGGTRSQYYIYYNGTRYNGAATIAPSVRATGFGGVAVFKGGPADGIAVVASHTPGAAALNSTPGDTVFTYVAVGPATPPQQDPKPGIDSTNQIIYVLTTGKARNGDYWLWKSSDYGTSFTVVDSLARWVTGIPAPRVPATEVLDPDFQVMPNGDIYVFMVARSVSAAAIDSAALPPIGTGNQQNVNRLGYLKSTNRGVSWTWTTAYYEGQKLPIAAGDTSDYGFPLSNIFFGNGLGKVSGCVDSRGVVHFVMNGTALHFTWPGATVNEVFSVMYWNSSSGTWKQISRAADTHNGANDSVLTTTGQTARQYCNGASGMPRGRSHPTIAYYPRSRDIFAAWTEPGITGSVQDTLNSKWVGQIWYATSPDGGTTWNAPVKLTSDRRGKYWTSCDRQLTLAGASVSTLRAHLVYLADQDNRCILATGDNANATLLKPYIYRWVDFPLTGVSDQAGLPQGYSLSQNYPNPFNPSTEITFTVPFGSNVSLKVYNVLGQEVATLLNEQKSAGTHKVDFSASRLASGVYFYTLNAGQFSETKKMVLMK